VRTFSLCLVLAGAAVLLASQAFAVQPPAQPLDGAVRLPTEQAQDLTGPRPRTAMQKDLAWADFRARHGQWDALWNSWTGTPHRAFGPSITVSGPVGDAASAHRIAMDFLRSEAPLTKATRSIELQERSTVRAGRVWYAHMKQLYEGIELLNTHVSVRLDESGRVMAFGSDVRDDIALDPRPLLGATQARAGAIEGLQFDVNEDRAHGGEDLYILPIEDSDQTSYALVRHVRVSQSSPPHEWETFVDAHQGIVRWRWDRVRHGSVSGTAIGEIRASSPNDPVVTEALPNLEVTFGGPTTSTVTDLDGAYAFTNVTGALQLYAEVAGPYARTIRDDVVNQGKFQTFPDADSDPTGVTVDLVAGAHPTETNGFYHTNLIHDYIKNMDPGAVGIDYQMPVVVNINDACNAFWNGSGINFFKKNTTAGCNNTVYVSDVVYHEYGHGINDKLYQQLGATFGMQNGALHEGLADVLATLFEDDPELGQGFYISTTQGIRNVDNTRRYPDDVMGQVHNDGLVIGGAFWDLRLLVGVDTAARLAHFAKYGLPDATLVRQAYQDYFLETLVADDDNGDLSDQTPNWDSIVQAFNLHGIGPSIFVAINHSGIEDVTAYDQDIQIDAIVYSSSTLFPLEESTVQLVYSVDGGIDQSVPMSNLGSGSWGGIIPAVGNGHIVRYHLTAGAAEGDPISNPGNPNVFRYPFLAGDTVQLQLNSFELDEGWTVGDVGDNATTGIWERAEPFGTFAGSLPVQPENDHTPQGSQCYVTGNDHGGDSAALGANDVDGGKTTLLSPVFDLSSTTDPVIRYWRWYTNASGSNPGTDVWRVEISDDGGATWTEVENTTASRAAWTPVIFRVEDYVNPTSAMRLRFVASDIGAGSVVEAALDDVEILYFDQVVVSVDDGVPGGRPTQVALHQNVPNPFNPSTRISFDLPADGYVSLRIYDLAGRLVRTLVGEPKPAGSHEIVWGGRDQGGKSVASGVYVVRLEANGVSERRRMVLAK
jgi:Zn-dependent metalloprotease